MIMATDWDCYDEERQAGLDDGMDDDEAMDNALMY